MMQKIKTPEEFNSTYQFSVERPEAFWASIAEEFVWKKKNGIPFCNGILRILILNGL